MTMMVVVGCLRENNITVTQRQSVVNDSILSNSFVLGIRISEFPCSTIDYYWLVDNYYHFYTVLSRNLLALQTTYVVSGTIITRNNVISLQIKRIVRTFYGKTRRIRRNRILFNFAALGQFKIPAS